MNNRWKLMLAASLVVLVLLAAGCSGGGAQRTPGLSADATVKAFYDAAKAGKINDAGLYVSPGAAKDPVVVAKYLADQSGLDQLKNSNLLSVREVTEQGGFSVVLASLQAPDSILGFTVKPVGLEKINGEWYIVDADQILKDAKYKLLLQLVSSV
ncbi:MAG: hypothetical protein P4N41_05995 [Negativicutes bacterium]|nr:hypothetical protein [Negativicutes bacterium]